MKKKYTFFLIITLLYLGLPSKAFSQCWDFTLGDAVSTIDQNMFPASDRDYFPDGNINVLQIGSTHYAFWSMYQNYRTQNTSPLLQDHEYQLNPTTPVFGGREPDNGVSNGFNDGGMWLVGVRALNNGDLVGFFHAESHWYPRTTNGWFAYKSLGVAYSSDNGQTWGTPQLILKHVNNKPSTPQWSGLGDACVIYNHLNNKYYCYYTPVSGSTALSMASSSDPFGTPGSWQKWNNGSFSQPGISGLESALPGLSQKPGANPSVHWNTYLNKFIMVWHGWDEKLYISASDDGEVWDDARLLLDEGSKTWYPVVIGTDSVNGGQTVTLYYANNFQPDGRRTMSYRTLSFSKGIDQTNDQLLPNGRYEIRNTSNNKNLAATGASNFDGVLVFPDIYTDQRWDVEHLGNNEYRLTHACCGGRLDVENSGCAEGAQVLSTTADDSSTSQIWKIDRLVGGNYTIRPTHCLTQSLSRESTTSDNIITSTDDICNELQTWSFIEETLSVEEAKKNSLNLVPNPVYENCKITGFDQNGWLNVEVYSINGQLVKAENIFVDQNATELNMQDLQKGLYILKLKQNNRINVMKLIKQ
jgi:hypothetical protein